MPGSKPLILVVDDNPLNLYLATNELEINGYQTMSAKHGSSALKILAENVPDLILLDVMMPDINGIELCKMIRNDEKFLDIPIIFVTASTDDAILAETYQSGGNDYVRKPFNKVELTTRIKALLDQKELAVTKKAESKLTGALELAGAANHEFNQPLQAILVCAELLAEQVQGDQECHALAELILEQSNVMGKITKKLKRITSYKTKIYLGKTQIIDLDQACQ